MRIGGGRCSGPASVRSIRRLRPAAARGGKSAGLPNACYGWSPDVSPFWESAVFIMRTMKRLNRITNILLMSVLVLFPVLVTTGACLFPIGMRLAPFLGLGSWSSDKIQESKAIGDTVVSGIEQYKQ